MAAALDKALLRKERAGVDTYDKWISSISKRIWQRRLASEQPFSAAGPYWETPEWQEKKKIRHVSNVMGWANFAVQALMIGLSMLCSQFLVAVGYPFSKEFLESGGMSPTMYYLLVSAVYIVAVALPFYYV